MSSKSIKNIKNIYFYVGVLLVGLFVGYGLSLLVFSGERDCSISYEYLNHNLGCNEKPVISKVVYLNFEKELTEYLSQEQEKGNLLDAGIYFRDLENGPTFGVNSGKLFISASLVKLPTVMAALRLSEQNPTFLKNKVLYSQEISSDNQDFVPEKKLQLGHSYTVEDLITRSLQYSDNAANALLVGELYRVSPSEDLIFNTFKDLGLVVPGDVTKGDISTKSYSSLFRLLYNASFLSKENSEKVLSILNKASFNQGIESGVPENIEVSTKFGERELDFVSNGGNSKRHINELHDCGIVYYPNNPYMLCIMTKGQDFNALAHIIQNISSMVYSEIDSRKLE